MLGLMYVAEYVCLNFYQTPADDFYCPLYIMSYVASGVQK
jgi:hypothetical protein